PIVYGHCAVCHRPGQAAPFPLLSYDDVKKRGTLIARATARRYMPPWHATDAPGFAEFRDDRRLSPVEIATLQAWVAAGMHAAEDSATIGANDALPGLGAGVLGLLRGRGAAARPGAGEGGAGGIGGWVPGMTPRFFPDGIAQLLPAHSNVVVQLHLHPSGKTE